MNKISKVVGIDLGTTNSCVAVIENGEYVILANEEGGLITPSCIAFNLDKDTGNLLSYIGEAAQRQAYANTKNTIYVFKRLMGKQFAEVENVAKTVRYDIVPGDDNEAMVSIFGQKKSPVYISGLFLQNLVNQVRARSGYTIKDVVITVPANFGNAQREATKQAGEIAGLNVLRIISEPTAAAMAYGMQNSNISGKIMVFDLGGGTFDVTLLDIQSGFFNVMGTGGDMNLGGEDFDQMIVEWILDEFKKIEGITLTDAITVHRIKTEAKQAKELLSSAAHVNINIPYVAPGPKHINLNLKRSWFEERIKSKILTTIEIAKNTMKTAGLESSHMERGILVGGSTRIPLVKKMLEDELNIKFYCDINPDAAIAIGAAYQASVLAGETSGLVLMDVTPLNIGIETVGGIMAVIIQANSKIPSESTKMFTTARDGQTEVEIKIYQGFRSFVSDNTLLGNMRLTGIKPAPRGAAKINVKLSVDANGILVVSATEETSNVSNELTISFDKNNDSAEVKRMKKEAEEQKERDEQRLKAVEAQNECEHFIYEIEKRIKEIKDTAKADEFKARLETIRPKVASSAEQEVETLRVLLTDIANYESSQKQQSQSDKPKDGDDHKGDDDNKA